MLFLSLRVVKIKNQNAFNNSINLTDSTKMPEKTSTSASFTLHYEQEKLAQLSEDATCESSCCDECEEEGMEDENDYESNFNDDDDDDNLPDLGEILGFRITGGSDFYMPITIFHVSINL